MCYVLIALFTDSYDTIVKLVTKEETKMLCEVAKQELVDKNSEFLSNFTAIRERYKANFKTAFELGINSSVEYLLYLKKYSDAEMEELKKFTKAYEPEFYHAEFYIF